eukprot:6206180-Pleurochrysis_carterae.AAC.4
MSSTSLSGSCARLTLDALSSARVIRSAARHASTSQALAARLQGASSLSLRASSSARLHQPPFAHALGCTRLASKLQKFSEEEKAAGRRAHIQEALKFVRAYGWRDFEAVELSVVLNIDVSRSDERVRGTCVLPHGTGKSVRVGVFARDKAAIDALNAGADVVGAEDLVKQVQDGSINFDRCLATPDMLPLLAKVARILGPKGLMPSPKRGTVVADIAPAVALAKAGELEFKMQEHGVVTGSVGKISFSDEQIINNSLAFL